MNLYEKYRPRQWSEVVGQDKVVKQIDNVRKRGLEGKVFWITGRSGCGKTTIARLIASDVADHFATEELNAIDVSMEVVRRWEKMCSYKPLGGKCYCFIINESHCLSSRVVSHLQTVLENETVQRNSTWLFTTTFKGQRKLFDGVDDAAPFLSRAIKLQLSSDVELAFAMRVRDILKAEGMNDIPLHVLADRLRKCECNMREVLQQIETEELVA